MSDLNQPPSFDQDKNGHSESPDSPDTHTEKKHTGISSASIRRPIGTIALTSVVIVLGLFMLDRLPIDLLPEINYPQIRVTVNYPGTAPEVMEQQITRVLERNLAATENLASVDSRASEGRTNVNLIFEYGTNIDLALQDASRHLERARTQLPPDIEPPRIYKMDPSDAPVYEAGFSSTTRTPLEVRDWMENELSPQIQSTSGVGGVEVAGGQIREMQVILDQDRLNYYNMNVSHVTSVLSQENRDIAAGNITSSTFDVMAKTDGQFRSAEDIRNVILTVPGSRERIRLAAVADVRDHHAEQRLFVRLNGDPATRLSVTKLPEANTVEVVDNVASELERLEASGFIPDDITHEVTTDQSFFVRASINSVSTAALLGSVLAMLVVLLFLGSLRKSFVIGLSIPIAIMTTFALMGASGITLNIMSLGGLALGVGLLLDNSIVMLENISRHREELRKGAEDSAHEGASEVASAVIASTMTNLAAVLPFLLITGITAMIFQELIITIAFAIAASLAVALTLVPMLAALMDQLKYRSGLDTSRFHQSFNSGLKRLTGRYKDLLRRVLHYRWALIGGAFLLLGLTYLLTQDLGNEFLPTVDDGNVGARVSLEPGATPEETDRLAQLVETEIQEMPHVENYFLMVGGHLSGGVISERPGTARFSISLSSASDRPEMSANQWVDQLQRRLDQLDLPSARASASPPSIPGIRTSMAGADISVGVVGDELEEIEGIARDIRDMMQEIDGLENFELARDDRSPLMRVDVDRERAAALGLNTSEVGEAVRTAVHGTVPTRFSTGTAEYDIRVMLPREMRATTSDLGGIRLFRENQAPVYLRDVASFNLGEGPAHITRENQTRISRVNGDVNTAITDVGSVNQQIRDRLVDYDMPQNISLIFGGEEEAIQETNRNLMIVILLALFMVFVVMAVQYERLANPLVILTAVPLALIGVGALLWITNTNLSAPVMLGVILLIGIVVNNAILLVEYIELGRKDGLSVVDAAVEAGGIRFRPILMTTLTTVCGMLPLAIGIGDGAELMQPLAIAVVGGLLVSMLLTLFVVPSLYLIISSAAEQLQQALIGRSTRDDAEPVLQGDGVHQEPIPVSTPAAQT